MGAQFLKGDNTDEQKSERKEQEEQKRIYIRKEPFIIDEGISITFNDIHHGIDIKEHSVFFRNGGNLPEDGGYPESRLEDHADNLTHVLGENTDSSCEPSETEGYQKYTEQIERKLEPVDGGVIPFINSYSRYDKQKNKMQKERRNYFDQRQDTHTEVNLFHQMPVVHNSVHSAVDAVSKIYPRGIAADKIEQERHMVAANPLEAHGKNQPDGGNEQERAEKRPEQTQI